jgi:thiol-disulfide isomerase/thioredoxin
MQKSLFWRGYLFGFVLTLALGIGALYFLFVRVPGIGLADVELEELDGTPVSLAQLMGRPVVLNYWATWCGPCVEEFPVFEQARQQAETVAFLMVSDEPAAKIQQFLRRHPYGFRFLRVRRPLPGVNVRPVTYGFDRRGTLITTHSGTITPPDLQALLKGL